MNGPIISYQLGKIRRKRLKAEAAAYRHAKTNETGKPGYRRGIS